MTTPTSDWFSAGGIVMFPLIGFSILSATLIFERARFWLNVLGRTDRFVREFVATYRRNQIAAFKVLDKNLDLPMGRIFAAALQLEEPNAEEFRLALESAAQAEMPILKRFNTVFETIINLSPLLGLLGTVIGLIRSFASIKSLGDIASNNATGVSGGVSEALVSTATGLGVAIFVLLFANAFRGLYLRQMSLIQEYGGQLELLYRRRIDRRAAPYIP
ncbi:MotA/TolQ/ExbB proton channel family protein, partial [filamentous cyanobacterium LEGE 11480]